MAVQTRGRLGDRDLEEGRQSDACRAARPSRPGETRFRTHSACERIAQDDDWIAAHCSSKGTRAVINSLPDVVMTAPSHRKDSVPRRWPWRRSLYAPPRGVRRRRSRRCRRHGRRNSRLRETDRAAGFRPSADPGFVLPCKTDRGRRDRRARGGAPVTGLRRRGARPALIHHGGRRKSGEPADRPLLACGFAAVIADYVRLIRCAAWRSHSRHQDRRDRDRARL